MWLLVIVFIISCTPKIYYFKSEQSRIATGDSVKLYWKTRGKPVMVVHEKTNYDDAANIKPGERLMEFMLAFKNSDKYQRVNVFITPKETADTIFLRTSDIHGDTLLATGSKLSEDLFTINEVTSVMNRILFIWHQNKMIVLPHTGSTSFEFNNTPVGGEWKLGTLLSLAEKKDHSIVPSELKILVSKKHK